MVAANYFTYVEYTCQDITTLLGQVNRGLAEEKMAGGCGKARCGTSTKQFEDTGTLVGVGGREKDVGKGRRMRNQDVRRRSKRSRHKVDEPWQDA